jgi:hypothetical protein
MISILVLQSGFSESTSGSVKSKETKDSTPQLLSDIEADDSDYDDDSEVGGGPFIVAGMCPISITYIIKPQN